MAKRMKSITAKWILAAVILICGVILMILASNTLFLRPYYVHKNKALFLKEYLSLKNQFFNPDKEFLELLRERDRWTGFSFHVSAGNPDQIVLSSIPGFYIEPPSAEKGRTWVYPDMGHRKRFEISREQSDFLSRNKAILKQGNELYGQIPRDNDSSKIDLVFAANLNPRYRLIIVRPIEQLDEHTAITNRFLLIIGMITLLISVMVAWISAGSVVRPLKEITDIGEHIANLDFSHKYTGSAQDEIGILGNSMNRISTQLDAAISDLEKTNSKLQKEMSLQKRFFAGVSHEFKTPVGLIRGYSESIKLGFADSPEKISTFSNIIIEEADRLNHLINDILVLVKSESTEFMLTSKEFDIISTLKETIEKNSPSFINKNIELRKDFPEEYCIRGDENRIRQIFENILSNALRHTPVAGQIELTAYSYNKGIVIRVVNEGNLIPEDHLPHLFKPFYSVFESREKSIMGTGLGLAIVKNLVEKHEGKYGIENSPDLPGVTLWIWLPQYPQKQQG